jgi:hypothetical protein
VLDHHVAHRHVADVGGEHSFCEVGRERLALRCPGYRKGGSERVLRW